MKIATWQIDLKGSKCTAHSLEAVLLFAILVLAAYLRLAHLAANPGWYTDEGTHLNIAQNLLLGKVQYLAINQSTLLFAKLPLFDLLLAGLLKLGADGLLTLRALTGVLGLVSTALLYVLVRHASSSGLLGLASALLAAIHPQAVLYSRFGFSYNLLTPLVLLAFLGLWNYLERAKQRWLALACLSIGVGAVSDLWMLALAAPALLVISLRCWRDIPKGLFLLTLPLGFTVTVILIRSPQAFWFDLDFTLSRLRALSLPEQIATIGQNITQLQVQDAWIRPALIGLLVLRPARFQRLCLLMFLFPLAILGRSVALYSLSAYYTIPLLPFVALGIASLVWNGIPYLFRIARDSLLAALNRWLPGHPFFEGLLAMPASLSLLIVLLPVWASLTGTIKDVRQGFITPIDPFLISANDAHKAASFVNTHTTTDDVVIASPAVAWLIEARTADFQMAIASTGQATPHLPGNIPADRFAFEPGFDRAYYMVVDNLWRRWGVVHVPGLNQIMGDLERQEPVFTAGEIAVYQSLRAQPAAQK